MESSGGEVNYWPGFVDALSNVVLTLVFVLVVFVFALVMASNKVEQKYQEIVEAKQQNNKQKDIVESEGKEIYELEKKLFEAKTKISTLEKQLQESPVKQDQEIEIKDSNDLNMSKAIVEGKEANKVSLKFSSSIVNMDEESQDKFKKTLDEYGNDLKTKTVLIRAYLDSETYSIGQRLAYYRILEVRNFLISKVGVAPNMITSKIVDGKGHKAGYVEILLNKK